ncbi:hypothetical protein GIB67_010561 [Kingdonia uniflora]|uniref:RNase H type-1 domain-containing protein n=1 Tax=Kingdonia uniflora TaxID=39325 RepID=A0A7J7MAS9_9MAGN|nr:hypothetical protein GIB67_010561 [Kingdonia uniflora]
MFVIWTSRNELLFDQKKFLPREALNKAKQYLVHHSRPPTPMRQVNRPAPIAQAGWHTINVDASWSKADIPGGTSFIIKTHLGNIVCAGHEAAQAEDSKEAEAISVIRGMKAGQQMGLDKVIILTDCQRFVRAYRDRSDDLSLSTLTLAPDMLAIVAQFRDFHFDFTERACNFEAHFLASRGARSPPFICSVPSEATMDGTTKNLIIHWGGTWQDPWERIGYTHDLYVGGKQHKFDNIDGDRLSLICLTEYVFNALRTLNKDTLSEHDEQEYELSSSNLIDDDTSEDETSGDDISGDDTSRHTIFNINGEENSKDLDSEYNKWLVHGYTGEQSDVEFDETQLTLVGPSLEVNEPNVAGEGLIDMLGGSEINNSGPSKPPLSELLKAAKKLKKTKNNGPSEPPLENKSMKAITNKKRKSRGYGDTIRIWDEPLSERVEVKPQTKRARVEPQTNIGSRKKAQTKKQSNKPKQKEKELKEKKKKNKNQGGEPTKPTNKRARPTDLPEEELDTGNGHQTEDIGVDNTVEVEDWIRWAELHPDNLDVEEGYNSTYTSLEEDGTPTQNYDGHTMELKSTSNLTHTCRGKAVDKNKLAHAGWVANEVEQLIRSVRSTRLCDVQEVIWTKYGVNVSYSAIWNAWTICIERIVGSYDEGYIVMPELTVQELLANPGSISTCCIDLMTNEWTGTCISYKGSMEGWLNGCMPLLGLDGCFLKGKYGGVCLFIIGLDGNNNYSQFQCSFVGLSVLKLGKNS